MSVPDTRINAWVINDFGDPDVFERREIDVPALDDRVLVSSHGHAIGL